MRAPYLVAAATVAVLVATGVVNPELRPKGFIPGMLAVGFMTTGTVIALRGQARSIGWLFQGTGFAAALTLLTHAVPDRLIADGHAGATVTGVVGAYASASWVPMMLPPLTLTLLLFPDGRLLGPRWRLAAWCAAVGMLVAFAGTLLAAGPLEDYRAIENPIGVEAVKGIDGPGFMLMFVSVVAGPTSLWLRWRRADRVTHEQIRWLAVAGAFAGVAFLLGFALFDVLTESGAYALMMFGVLTLPVATAIAILRYRLYDIDVVINRALVYLALTVTLVGAYLVTVLLAQLVLPERSDLGVAVSTLAAAAIFTPARRRIQAEVDRRFFRRRYDAELTLAAFGSRLRDEVDLATLSEDLRGVVTETVQPAHVSLWLRGS